MRTNKTASHQEDAQDKSQEQVERERNERWAAIIRQNAPQPQPPAMTPPGLNRPRR